jgi:hypothetical protein
MRINATAPILLSLLLFLTVTLMGCSRGDVPLPTIPASEIAAVPTEIFPTQTATPAHNEKYPLQIEYAAVWALSDEGLIIRSQAGISSTIAEVLPWDSREIYLTGNRSLLGSSLWLEIQTESGNNGWVRARNLTEYIPSDQFCNDMVTRSLLDSFQQTLQARDGTALKELVSPNRGLSIRLNWYSPDVTYAITEVNSIFIDTRELDWGIMADSGLQVVGSFEAVIQPKLEDVFSGIPEVLCNELKWGSTAGQVLWPEELDRLNFYTFHRSAKEGGNELDWRTWAVGIEYVNNQPFIAILIHYSSEL